MSSGYVIPVDPADIAARFAAPEPALDDDREEDVGEMDSIFQSDAYETQIMPLLDLIPDREADLIYLYYVCKKRQADIAHIFNVTQAAISYRLDRGIQRIKFLLSIPRVTEEDMREDLAQVFDPIDIDILVGMWQTTCQSEVASKLKLTQGRVRHRFFKAVDTLEGAVQKVKEAQQDAEENGLDPVPESILEPYRKIFSSISSKNFNILRAVQLPQWSNRGVDRCM